jgi:flagellar hook assembly protein FlgD
MSALTGAGSVAAVSSASQPQGDFGELTNNEFFEIMMAELSSQDPLEPNDTTALMEQIALIRSIESDTSITDNLGDLLDQSSFNSAAGLIGALVSGVSESGQRIADLVISVSRTPDGAVLNTADGSRVPIDNVDEVLGRLADAAPDDPGDDDPDNDDDSGDTP